MEISNEYKYELEETYEYEGHLFHGLLKEDYKRENLQSGIDNQMIRIVNGKPMYYVHSISKMAIYNPEDLDSTYILRPCAIPKCGGSVWRAYKYKKVT